MLEQMRWGQASNVRDKTPCEQTCWNGLHSINGISIAGAISTTLNDEKELIQIVDVLGRKISSDTQKVTLLFIYKDGSVVKKHVIK